MGHKSSGTLGSEAGGVAGGIIGSVIPVVGTGIGAKAGSALGGMLGNELGGSGGGGMGGLVSGGKGGGGTGASNAYAGNLAGLGSQIAGIAPNFPPLATQAFGVGQDAGVFGRNVLNQGLNQYTAGAMGALTPAQQALTNFNLGQMNDRTNATFGNLGLGGSTMQAQDLSGNALQSMAQQEQIDLQNQQMGLMGMQTGNQLMGTNLAGLTDAGGLYSQEANVLGGAGQMYNAAATGALAQQNAFQNMLSGGGLGSLSNLLGGSSSGGGSGILGKLGKGGTSAGGMSTADIASTMGTTDALSAVQSMIPFAIAA